MMLWQNRGMVKTEMVIPGLGSDAEGKLLVCIGKATKVDLIVGKDKTYDAVLLRRTKAQDMTGIHQNI